MDCILYESLKTKTERREASGALVPEYFLPCAPVRGVRGGQAARGYSHTSTDGTHELVVGYRRGVVSDFSAGEGYNLQDAADSSRNEQRRRGRTLAYWPGNERFNRRGEEMVG
jgi:hypothetical protein